jgi:hypothetical protein
MDGHDAIAEQISLATRIDPHALEICGDGLVRPTLPADGSIGIRVEAGKVRLLVGASSSDIRLRRTILTSGTFALRPDLLQAAPQT